VDVSVSDVLKESEEGVVEMVLLTLGSVDVEEVWESGITLVELVGAGLEGGGKTLVKMEGRGRPESNCLSARMTMLVEIMGGRKESGETELTPE